MLEKTENIKCYRRLTYNLINKDIVRIPLFPGFPWE